MACQGSEDSREPPFIHTASGRDLNVLELMTESWLGGKLPQTSGNGGQEVGYFFCLHSKQLQ